MNEKMTKTELTFDQVESRFDEKTFKLRTNLCKSDSKCSSTTQVGIPLYSIIITKWNEYQSEYLRQKPYREGHRGNDERVDNPGPKTCNSGYSNSRVEESRGEESSGEAHFNIKFEFLKRLRILEEEFEEIPDNSRDEGFYNLILNRYRTLDPIREIDSIRELFKKNPGEVTARIKAGKPLIDQLHALFETAAKYAGLKG